jgi:ADP-ribosylglycohydrolase
MIIPDDYNERVYAGVLGKMIGVYLGRPFEGWTYARIMQELGEIWTYVHDRLGKPLVVTDDDLTGTFTFLRAMADYGYPPELTPAQVGRTWLNYLIEGRTILWWGGLGNSTEHTAYLRLKKGLEAPLSGSAAVNGKITSEQIGAQIFIDGWGMAAPGEPELAASLARRAASVSHDGEAIYGAQVIAAMEAQAFVEHDLDRLIDTAVGLIQKDSVIYRLIGDLREWRAGEPDWRRAREKLEERYGYHTYRGNCHIVPNHGLVMLGLLYGEDDFQKSLMIVNTCGWDTDCNSGNAGCLLGIKNGLAAFETGPDWRGPAADRLLLPTADGGRAISDAVRETYFIANTGRVLAGEAPEAPKSGARFHFELPGSVQGFRVEDDPAVRDCLRLVNTLGHSRAGRRSLAFRFADLLPGGHVRASTGTFILPEDLNMPGYPLLACPTLYAGQTLRAGLEADEENRGPVVCRLFCRSYGAGDEPQVTYGPEMRLSPGECMETNWDLASPPLSPAFKAGLELRSEEPNAGAVYLDYLTWDGTPQITFTRPEGGGVLWRRAWVEGVDRFVPDTPEAFRLVQNDGRGLLMQGTSDWTDYRVHAPVTPNLARSAGIAARVGGLRRYYSLELSALKSVRLVKMLDEETCLAEKSFDWEFGQTVHLALDVDGDRLRGWVNGEPFFDVRDERSPLRGGGIAFVIEEGCLSSDWIALASKGGAG